MGGSKKLKPKRLSDLGLRVAGSVDPWLKSIRRWSSKSIVVSFALKKFAPRIGRVILAERKSCV